ncbi:DUF309 domain-containing protein [Mycolicibacterium sp. CBMA 234]|uniref:DUF309 domain-containing protein n=1 Tax=Mycolicibacterium sp. CBMA 234 TaxID=1918495 RepID=UPI0028151C88|nr:DUF309 domain-containing protein [Mycolicibacterium sp. CBMA 234]
MRHPTWGGAEEEEVGWVIRDRDESGRPRNSRPRDALGRPLPPGSTGVPRIPDDLCLPPVETLSYAQELLDGGLAFNAHEVFEAAWKNGPESERLLWQSLAQLAVGITHVQRRNDGGAAALLRRAGDGLVRTSRPVPYSIDVDGLIACAAALVADLDRGTEIDPARLRPLLTAA